MTDVIDNWGNSDKLGRKESADFLTNFLAKRYALASKHDQADTFVLNIRADWGFGKSFFLQRWAKDLADADFPVVFFDAWANDFSDDPLIGFIAEINAALSDRFKSIPVAERYLDNALSIGRRLIKPVSLGIASALAKKISGYDIEQLKELFSVTDDESSDDSEKNPSSESTLISTAAEAALSEHLGKKEAIAVFKKRLGRLIEALKKEASIQLPLFIFIDELDRCRPTYAIELLEAIKHLFGVPGIYFVVATNLEQLGHSIRAVYGEQFDSERYLKRFFDQEYLLPSPNNTRFTAFLFEHYSLNKLGNYYTAIEDGIYGEVPTQQILFSVFSENFGLSLRDQEQVAGTLQAVLLNWPTEERIHLAHLLFLVIAKHISSSVFRRLTDNPSFDSSKFDETLFTKLRLRPNAVFRTYDFVKSNNGYDEACTVTNHKIRDLLHTYQSLSHEPYLALRKRNINALGFPDKIAATILQDAPRMGPPDLLSPLSTYAHRVSQAGQLTIPAKQN